MPSMHPIARLRAARHSPVTVGNLQLTDAEENQIVLILMALTDGFDPANPSVSSYPNINTFTGQCSIGGSAATQGNEFLIPTPPLPPCAPEICGIAPLPRCMGICISRSPSITTACGTRRFRWAIRGSDAPAPAPPTMACARYCPMQPLRPADQPVCSVGRR